MAGIGTLHEIKTQWDIDDLADANDLLDLKEELLAKQQEEHEKQLKKMRKR